MMVQNIHRLPSGVGSLVAVLLITISLALTGCVQMVWVKLGATTTDFQVAKGRCLAASYSSVPSAPAVATFGSGYVSPVITNCSGIGYSVNCITTGGQYTPPVSIPYDANARVRAEVFKSCMYADGWILERRTPSANTSSSDTNETDWSKGLEAGTRGASCDDAPAGISIPSDWSLGCRSGHTPW